MDIQDMRIFARVAALQNLSAVATELGLTPGTISKRIQAMETELTARLFDRTTRSIRITSEGETFLIHVERIMSELEQAYAAVGEVVAHPKGKITISAPVSLGRRYIMPAISAFMNEYRDIDVSIDLTDRMVNLQEDGYDLAIRTGELSDSTLIAKRLSPDTQLIVAAPSYLKANGIPKDPAQLSAHNCLLLNDTTQWSFQKDGTMQSVRITGRLRSNNSDLLHHAALDGQGIIRTSRLQAGPELERGKLQEILGDYNANAASAVWAIYPSAKHVLPKLRVFLDFLGDWFRAPDNQPRAGVTAPLDIVAASQTGSLLDDKRAEKR